MFEDLYVQKLRKNIEEWQNYAEGLEAEKEELKIQLNNLKVKNAALEREKFEIAQGIVFDEMRRRIRDVQKMRTPDLTRRERQVLEAIKVAPKCPYIHEVIKATDLPHTTVSNAIDGLRRKCYVKTKKHGKFRYIKLYKPPKDQPKSKNEKSHTNITCNKKSHENITGST